MPEHKQPDAASGGIRPSPCADRSCRFFSDTSMCSRCYEEKVAKPMEELEATLAEIRRVNAGKQHVALGQPRTVGAVAEARNVASSRGGTGRRVGVRNCS